MHSGVSLILEVNGRSSDGNFRLQSLAGPHGSASDLYSEAFISVSVNVHGFLSVECECGSVCLCVSPVLQTTTRTSLPLAPAGRRIGRSEYRDNRIDQSVSYISDHINESFSSDQQSKMLICQILNQQLC